MKEEKTCSEPKHKRTHTIESRAAADVLCTLFSHSLPSRRWIFGWFALAAHRRASSCLESTLVEIDAHTHTHSQRGERRARTLRTQRGPRRKKRRRREKKIPNRAMNVCSEFFMRASLSKAIGYKNTNKNTNARRKQRTQRGIHTREGTNRNSNRSESEPKK